MGAKTSMIVYSDGGDPRSVLRERPGLDRAVSLELATALFPKERLTPLEDGDLSFTSPPGREMCVGCFPGVSIIAAKEFALDRPSQLPRPFLDRAVNGTLTLHAMHSVVDWFAYARWEHGQLIRSLSVSPENGIIEDLGKRLPFEDAFWSGQHPVQDDEEDSAYPLPFHPLELGEAALATFFGYQLEGPSHASLFDPEGIALARYQRARSLWSFWK